MFSVVHKMHTLKKEVNMQYLSARQMWHDAYYATSANTQLLELNRSNSNLLRINPVMNETQTRGPADNSSRVMHMAKAGRVQSEIAKLPEYLQAFGNYCWSPKQVDDLPSYKHANAIVQALVSEVKEVFPDVYSYYSNSITIIAMNVLKYECDREKGRKVQSLDIVIANSLALPKSEVTKKFGKVIKHIRTCIRDMNLDCEHSRDLDMLAKKLVSELEISDKKLERAYMLAKLALKSFAHKDQAYLFSGNEEKSVISPRQALYASDYVCWRIKVHLSNYKRDGYEQMFSEMLRKCEDWAKLSLSFIPKFTN